MHKNIYSDVQKIKVGKNRFVEKEREKITKNLNSTITA